MRILALDIGARAGIAIGDTGNGAPPRIEAWRLRDKDDSHERGAANLACALNDLIKPNPPDLIAVEQYLSPVVQKSADVITSHLLAHGAVEAVAALNGIRVVRPTVNEIRQHFIGCVTVRPRTRQQRTGRQRADDRAELNSLVVARAIMLGYLGRDCADWDKAAAAAVWDYSMARYARRIPAALVLFGERRA
jgi:hypothetical protein